MVSATEYVPVSTVEVRSTEAYDSHLAALTSRSCLANDSEHQRREFARSPTLRIRLYMQALFNINDEAFRRSTVGKLPRTLVVMKERLALMETYDGKLTNIEGELTTEEEVLTRPEGKSAEVEDQLTAIEGNVASTEGLLGLLVVEVEEEPGLPIAEEQIPVTYFGVQHANITARRANISGQVKNIQVRRANLEDRWANIDVRRADVFNCSHHPSS